MRIEICGAESMMGNADGLAFFGAATKGPLEAVCCMHSASSLLGAVVTTDQIACNAPGIVGKGTLER